MTLYLGIDESILRVRKREQAFIYVGTFTKDDSQGEERKNLSKIREERKLNLNCLAGFLFGVFLFDNSRKKEIITGSKNYKQFQSVYTLIDEGFSGAENLGILNETENIKIEIDGHDTYRIGEPLKKSFKGTKYENRLDFNFIARGDQNFSIINQADMIAYFLRELKGIENGIDSDLQKRGLEALLNEKNPTPIKRITPYHLAYPFGRAA